MPMLLLNLTEKIKKKCIQVFSNFVHLFGLTILKPKGH